MFDFNSNTKFMFDETGDMSYIEERFCPRCGSGLTELLRFGTVGCATCYKTFEKEIKDIVLQKHGAVCHIGKISSKHISKIKIREKIAELEVEKDKAARDENYIIAESLKNQIEKLKGEL